MQEREEEHRDNSTSLSKRRRERTKTTSADRESQRLPKITIATYPMCPDERLSSSTSFQHHLQRNDAVKTRKPTVHASAQQNKRKQGLHTTDVSSIMHIRSPDQMTLRLETSRFEFLHCAVLSQIERHLQPATYFWECC